MLINKSIFAIAVAALAAPAVAASEPAANSAAASSARSATSAAATAQTAAIGSKETKYCIEYEKMTGSRIRHTECRPKADWATRGVDVDKLDRK